MRKREEIVSDMKEALKDTRDEQKAVRDMAEDKTVRLELEVLLDIRDFFVAMDQILMCLGEAEYELRRKRD